MRDPDLWYTVTTNKERQHMKVRITEGQSVTGISSHNYPRGTVVEVNDDLVILDGPRPGYILDADWCEEVEGDTSSYAVNVRITYEEVRGLERVIAFAEDEGLNVDLEWGVLGKIRKAMQ